MDDFVELLMSILQYEFNDAPSQCSSILKRVLDLQLLAKVYILLRKVDLFFFFKI